MAPGSVHPLDGRPERSVTAGLDLLAESRPRGTALGLYIHVPFCAARCPYCSFTTARLEDGAMGRYLTALRRELAVLGGLPWARQVALHTIFLGGGTPSLLTPDELAGILGAVADRFVVEAGAEVTVECNPESVARDTLEAYRAAGVNRLSLGVQSLDDALLARLGRLHDARGARAAFEAARSAGFDNVSVDLMYGLPGLDLAGWIRTVETVLAWSPAHLSAYGLTLDAGSPWGADGIEGLPPGATVVAQYWALARAAAAGGWEHYEISNYARPSFRSRHNQIYWRAAEYLGCGPGAAGFVGDVRYGNARSTPRYCAALDDGALPIETSERLTDRQRRAERLILGLRLADGVPARWLDDRLEGDAPLAARARGWQEAGFLVWADGRVALTEAGFLVSDAIFVDLLESPRRHGAP